MKQAPSKHYCCR